MSERDTALSQALAAYAGVTSGEMLDTALVRSRILQSVRAPRPRSLRRLSIVLPLVAVLAASAAFAASQPALRRAVRASFAALLGRGAAPLHTRRPQRPRRAAEAAASAAATAPAASVNAESALQAQAPLAIDALPLAIDALPLAVPTSSGPGAAPPGAARPIGEAAGLTPAPDTPNEADAQLDAYRTAHRAHFDGGSPAASLAAWDRYLADFPAGSFADDARFNRALCLIRLGRMAEARRALTPFAAAPPGSYRQIEAASLLQGLGGAGLRSSK